jgi:hypothetical protein
MLAATRKQGSVDSFRTPEVVNVRAVIVVFVPSGG